MASVWIVSHVAKRRQQALPHSIPAGRPRSVDPVRRELPDEAARRVERKHWLTGELAARRSTRPLRARLDAVEGRRYSAKTAERWKASRVDVSEGNEGLQRVALDRVLPILGNREIDTLTGDDVAAPDRRSSSAAGKKRETIRKSVKYLAAVLDYAGVDPNPARDKQRVRLPYEELEEMNPPSAAHVEAVYRLLAPSFKLPLLWLDWSGARVASVDSLRVGDYDERDRRIRLRASTTKTRQALWVELPDVLADALEASLRAARGPRRRRRLFPGVSADRLRTAIARACKASGVPVFITARPTAPPNLASCTARGGRGRRSRGS